ncbi:hypothetical protein D3C78_1285260 [compost metagenome]
MQFQRPAAVIGQAAQLAGMRQQNGNHHVDGDDQSAQARVDANDEQHGRDDFAHVDAIGQKARQAMRRQHAADARYAAAHQFGQAVKQNQDAKGQAQDQLAGIVGLDHGEFLL